jgi:hypothetical protein
MEEKTKVKKFAVVNVDLETHVELLNRKKQSKVPISQQIRALVFPPKPLETAAAAAVSMG